jgi:Uncharacterized ACR, COG1430
MNRFLLTALLLLLCTPAHAQRDVQPIIYNRVILKYIPKPEPKPIPSPLPAPMPMVREQEPAKAKGELLTKADAKKQEELKVSKILPPEGEQSPPPPRTSFDFTVEIKTPDFLIQDDFITHSMFGKHEGLLILIDPVAEASLTASRMVGTSDVIFINEDGIITKIAPNLNLADLAEPIASGKPIRAFLFIKAKSAEQDRIIPGDRFENGIFKTHPVILQ